MSQLQQCFEHDVILMVVGDEGIVDGFGEVSIAVASHASRMCVADEGITENSNVGSFNQNAGMAEIADSDAVALVGRVMWQGVGVKRR